MLTTCSVKTDIPEFYKLCRAVVLKWWGKPPPYKAAAIQKVVQERRSAFGGKVPPNWNTMLKLAYALHKLRVKHATR